jgi:hypothetical protein
MQRTRGLALSFSLIIAAGLVTASSSDKSPSRVPPSGVTYSKDIAPILQSNCVKCHRPGEVAPMSFTSYKEVRPWARSIREMVVERKMPPWFADPHYGEYSNDCRLSQKDIDAISAWVEGGAPEGDAKDLPAPAGFLDGWNIGKPDVIITMPEKFDIPAEGVISYKFFIVPTGFKEDRYVQLAEIRPDDRAHVHHIIVDVKGPDRGAAPAAGEITPERAFGSRDQSAESDGRLVGWAPGEAPLTLKPGQAKLLKAGSSLIFQVHYTTNGVTGHDRSSVGLIFSRVPVEKRMITAGAVAHQLAIPPGDPNYEASASFVFKEDSHIDSLHPHMHFRGKDFRYTLIYPDGTSRVLLSVPRWDFGWQLTYFLKEPVAAPKGSRLECVAHYDNSANNKFNPDPTKLVEWGPQTWEEMMIGYIDYTIDRQNLRLQTETASK